MNNWKTYSLTRSPDSLAEDGAQSGRIAASQSDHYYEQHHSSLTSEVLPARSRTLFCNPFLAVETSWHRSEDAHFYTGCSACTIPHNTTFSTELHIATCVSAWALRTFGSFRLGFWGFVGVTLFLLGWSLLECCWGVRPYRRSVLVYIAGRSGNCSGTAQGLG